MAHDVFISYATENKPVADLICNALEKNGIRCWYAPRNVPSGRGFEKAILDAIRSSRLVILIFSSDANNSEHVTTEITHAWSKDPKKTIIQFRLENIELNETLSYYLHSKQWFDALTPPPEAHLSSLVEDVRACLKDPDLVRSDDDNDPSRNIVDIIKAILKPSLTASLVIFIAAWVGFFNLFNLDDWLERKFISYMDRRVEKRFNENDLRMILADENRQGDAPSGDPQKSDRRYHAELVNALAGAKAKVVAFDVNFEEDSEWDEQFAQAIRDATASGTRILVGTRGVEDGKPKVALPEKLREPLRNSWANTEIGIRTGDESFVRKLQLAQKITTPANEQEAEEIPVTPSLALRAFMEAQDQPPGAFFNADDGEIHVWQGREKIRSIPVDDDLHLTLDLADQTALEKITRSYQGVYADRAGKLDDFRNKIVLIGYRKGDLHEVSESSKRYGAEIQANAISNILEKVYIKHLSPAYDFFVILLMGSMGALLRTRLGDRVHYKILIDPKIIKNTVEIPVTLLVISIIYFIIIYMVYKQYRLVLDMTYHIAALFSLYWIVGLTLKRPGFRMAQKEVTP